MSLLSQILVLLVAALHVGFLVLEMFLWNTPTGHRIFRQTPQQAADSAVLAANQGLYNGFLAAGLVWGWLIGDRAVCVFFLACVVVAGIYGGLTAKRSILFMQALPGALALASLWLP